MKTCRICNTEKDISEYYKKKTGKDGYTNECKVCLLKSRKDFHVDNRDRLNAIGKSYYNKNKEAISAYGRTYYKENKEAIDKYKKKYNEENKETLSSIKKLNYDKNRNAILAQKKKYYNDNKELIKSKSRDYYNSNKESQNANSRAYNEKNRESIAIRNKSYRQTEIGKLADRNSKNKRRAQKLATSDKTIPIKYEYPLTLELSELMIRQDHKCVYCDAYLSLDNTTHLDHIEPLSKGGHHSINNVQWLCSTCNLEKSNLSEYVFLARIDT